MTGTFGEARTGHTHAGQDIAAPTGTAVRAAQCGTVTSAGADGSGYGNLVCIQHEGGVSTCYAHLSQIDTTKGAYVHVGDVIGKVGCTGSCTGPHLHFEVRENGKATNPAPYLEGSKTIAGRRPHGHHDDREGHRGDDASHDTAPRSRPGEPGAGGPAGDGDPATRAAPADPDDRQPRRRGRPGRTRPTPPPRPAATTTPPSAGRRRPDAAPAPAADGSAPPRPPTTAPAEQRPPPNRPGARRDRPGSAAPRRTGRRQHRPTASAPARPPAPHRPRDRRAALRPAAPAPPRPG